ncbi:MAG TPA: histidinol-phosphate transaminase [bacterium]|nr:histidinol-phosphate transaminase [bacterium]
MNEAGIISRVRTKIRDIKAYKVKELDYDVIKVDKNENPYDLPQDLKKEILEYALERSWSRYPPIVAQELYKKIAEYAGWTPDGIIAGNGADEMILTILLSFLEPGMKLVIPVPSFPMYPYIATLIGADVVEVPMNKDFTFDYDALENTFLKEGNALAICSPNNPTGTLFPLDRLENILEKTDAPVIVDEAYYEFSRITVLELLKTYDNLIIIRTFSKGFSFAGLRVGYALMDPELAVEIGKVKMPFNINIFSIAAASKLLENRTEIENTQKEIVKERDSLFEALNSINGLTVYPSSANFILFKTPYESDIVYGKILEDGVLVRNLSANPLLKNTLRITVSKPDDNKKFIDSLTRVMGELRKRQKG